MLEAIGVEQWSKEVKARLQFGRAGGYSGLDIVLLLFFYFSSGLKCGIKEFCRLIAKAGYRLAAMAGSCLRGKLSLWPMAAKEKKVG